MSGYITGGLIAGAAVYGASSYSARKAGHAMRQAQANAPKAPPAPIAATPATLANSITASNRIPGSGGGKRGGTIGDNGPKGLTAAPQTAGLTLLGGTK